MGELNVRNALAVVACAKHCGLKNKQIQSAFDTFKGIKRRMEVRGIAGGVTVVDDFRPSPHGDSRDAQGAAAEIPDTKNLGHLRAAHQHDAPQCFSNRTGRGAFADADAVVVAQVARLEQLPAEQRLDPARLMQDIKASGKDPPYLPDVDAIVAHVEKDAQGGDVVCVFSNGGFGGIHPSAIQTHTGSRPRSSTLPPPPPHRPHPRQSGACPCICGP